jgi:dimethylglycine dehydrogenase
VGYVSSGGWGPVARQHIALGYVDTEAYREDGAFQVELFESLHKAQLQTQPLYDPAGARMRG